jgi:rod shape determining protein RodA
MKQFFSAFDWLFFLAILIITSFSLILNYFLVRDLFPQQIFYIFLGLLTFFVFSRIDFRIWEKLGMFGFLGSIMFLLTLLVFGTITRGAVRWIRLGPFTLQPSELVKPFLIIFFASFFASSEKINLRRVMSGFLLLLIPLFLIFIQPDLGSSLVVGVSWLGILFAWGVSLKIIFGGMGIGIVLFPLIWKFFLREYQKHRILSFLDPQADSLGRGYNLIQSTVAVGAGKFFGRGLGGGTQSSLRFLPERHTDFIFASFAEDFGFLGVVILVLAFGVLLWRILRIAQGAKNPSARLFCFGVFSLLLSQGFINMGMSLGLLPVAGVTFPLLSYGGSSFLATMIMLGIVENICYNSNAFHYV